MPESESQSKGSPAHDRQKGARRLARILRKGGYSYDQSAHLFKLARKMVGLQPPKRKKKGAAERLTSEELEAFLAAAYEHSGRRGLMMRALFETGMRVGAFARMDAEQIAFRDLEVRVEGKGDKRRDVPILDSLANELRLHLGERRTGPVFQSRQGGTYSKRRLQQIVREVAREAGITKRVYPHLLRHTVAQHLADRGMPEELLQKFLGHEKPETTQVYYRPARTRVKRSFKEAMENQGGTPG